MTQWIVSTFIAIGSIWLAISFILGVCATFEEKLDELPVLIYRTFSLEMIVFAIGILLGIIVFIKVIVFG